MNLDKVKEFFKSKKQKNDERYQRILNSSIPISHLIKVETDTRYFYEDGLEFECPNYEYFVLTRNVDSLSRDVLTFKLGSNCSDCAIAMQVTGDKGIVGRKFKVDVSNAQRIDYTYNLNLSNDRNGIIYFRKMHGTTYEDVKMIVGRYLRNNGQNPENITNISGADLQYIAIMENKKLYEQAKERAQKSRAKRLEIYEKSELELKNVLHLFEL